MPDTSPLAQRLALPGRVHFAGVCGVGMAGVAWLLRRFGWDVSGCDAARGPLAPWLETSGVRFLGPHDPDHIAAEAPDVLVRTPAVRDSVPELVAAREAGVPVVPRGEVLAALSEIVPTVAVCGSHGKTTTSTFLATILHSLRPESTAWCIGGPSASLGAAVAGWPEDGAAAPNKPKPILVAEADESDGTLALYRPAVTVLTNLDLDHVDRFASVDAFEDVFRRVVARTAGPLVFCADHQRAAALAAASGHEPRISFGFSDSADVRILDWAPTPAGGQRFSLQFNNPPSSAGSSLSALRSSLFALNSQLSTLNSSLSVPGHHNALNAAAAVAAAVALGCDPAAAIGALARSASLPARRFERIGEPDGFSVVSDYSHHPSEIAALVETARGVPHSRIVAVFQPHRYSRTKTFLEDFPPAFAGVDDLVLCPVYAASEDPIPGGSAADLYAAFRRRTGAAGWKPALPGEPHAVPAPVLAGSLEDAFRYVRATLRSGDLVLVVGAGDVNGLAPRIAELRPADTPPPRPVLSGYGTSAPVPRYRVVESVDSLRAALVEARAAGQTPAVVGAGTNTLVAATGCYRPVLRLRGEEFSYVVPCGEDCLDVGAAYPGPHLLDYCRALGFSGLEFMAGIPGFVGGWLAMNAGTRDGAFCDAVQSVLALRISDGVQVRLERDALRAGYRSCPGLEGIVAVSVRVRVCRTSPEVVAAAMEKAASRRFDFTGLRTCGSAFRNPPSPVLPAGALSDSAGCKGFAVGGARVSERHGNIVVAGPGTTASDVEALLAIVAERVEADSGVRLRPELRILH